MSNQHNIIRSIDHVYASALVDLAQDAGCLEEIAAEVKDIIAGLGDQPQFTRLISAPSLTVEERAAVIERIFKGRVHDLIFRFLMVLNRKGRQSLFPGVFHAFLQVYSERHGVVEVEVLTAQSLNDMQKGQIAQAVGNVLGRQAVVHEKIDPTVIGGVRLRIGDQLIDGTVVSQLRQLRQEIIDSGRESAREKLATLTID